ncbi:MAG TPA: sugar phosphate nucleotidyltransferase [Bacteroidota bacterium]|nr:sugar phosphate nucleotidyltransferase [Bacteroidota bacterium]
MQKAVITAAARNERLYPAATTVQKSMLPVIDVDGINKPIIQIIAEEAFQSGIEELCIVCAAGDEERYRESFQTLCETSQKLYPHKSSSVPQAQNIKTMLDRLTFVVQAEPRGYGHAVYQAKEFVKNEPFLLLHGDYLYTSSLLHKRCSRQIIELAEHEHCSVAAVNPTLEHLIGKYGTLTGRNYKNLNGVYQIEKIVEKPSVSQAELELKTAGLRAGFYLCFFGMYVFQPILFDLLTEELKTDSGGPILLTPVQQKLAEQEKYLALEIQGKRYDTSKIFGLFQAQLALGLAGQLRDEVLTTLLQTLADYRKES